MSHPSLFPPSKKLRKRKKLRAFPSPLLLLLLSHSHQGTSNSWNGHRLTLWTTGFIFSFLWPLPLCRIPWKSAMVRRRFAHLKNVCSSLLLQISHRLPWGPLSVVMISMGWIKFKINQLLRTWAWKKQTAKYKVLSHYIETEASSFERGANGCWLSYGRLGLRFYG